MAARRALITGITGQDGSYLAEFLLRKGYAVYGMHRRTTAESYPRIEQIRDRLTLYCGDLHDSSSLMHMLEEVQPHEIYHLAGQSFVHVSWQQPLLTSEVTGLGTLRLLEAVRRCCPNARFYQAGSSEMFGSTPGPQSEESHFHPRSPYAVAKVFAHHATVNARESYDLFACNGILFNHESPRRGLEFVTRKISQTAAKIKLGLAQELRLGELSAKRDWGFAGDYVQAMWLMLQQRDPEDFVIGTGICHTVQDFVTASFELLDLNWKDYVIVDQQFIRPAEVASLQANPAKAEAVLKWTPTVGFEQLVTMMVEHDLEAMKPTVTYTLPTNMLRKAA